MIVMLVALERTVRLLRGHSCIPQILIGPVRRAPAAKDISMTDAVFHRPMEMPALRAEQEAQHVRALQQNQSFVVKLVNAEVA